MRGFKFHLYAADCTDLYAADCTDVGTRTFSEPNRRVADTVAVRSMSLGAGATVRGPVGSD